MDAKTLNRGDKCPQCDGDFRIAPGMTPEQYAKAYDRENPAPIPSHMDTASPEVRERLGELARCRECGYVTRFPIEKKKKPAPVKED
jgi:predicted Zn-ribbon and HTH transcriptional regulator